ncbi:HAD family hydrolase [Bacillus infantis]|uniref:HAD family hydrolase n=1 Tax=Bacillus infantis TaxID=324767 RepID=UPI003B977255
MQKNFTGDILFPGVHTLIQNLKREGIKIALASSSDKGRINRVLKDCDIEHLFEVVVSGDEFADSKPHPNLFLHTASLLGLNPVQCIVIEDSYNG